MALLHPWSRAHTLLRPLGARQATPVHWALSKQRVRQLQVGLEASRAAEPAQQPSSGQQQQPKYRGVARYRSNWCAQSNIPKAMLPGSTTNTRHATYGYSTPEAAARAADVQLIALRGDAARSHLNFPADSYSEAEVAEQRAVLQAKYPGLQLGNTAAAGRPGLYLIKDRCGALAAAARAAEKVGSVYDGSSQLTGVVEVKDAASDLMYTVQIQVRSKTRVQYQLQPLTYMAAGCAYDMARIVLYGPQHSVNFPPDVYSSCDIEAIRRDMQMVRPDMLKAAAMRKPPPLNYHNIQARAAADAAVAAEVAAAEAARHDSSFGTEGVTKRASSSAYEARVYGRPSGSNRPVACAASFNTALAAACAADMMRLALGRLAVNLPGHAFSTEGVAAMAAWLQLEGERLATVPAAIAAAVPAAGQPATASSRRRRAARQRTV